MAVPSRSGGSDGSPGSKCTIGGQIVAYTNRLTRVSCDSVIKLGSAVALKYNIGKIQYVSIGTYWPCSNVSEGSFQSHISRAYNGLSAIQTIKSGVEMAIHAAIDSGRTVLIGGDFNSDLGVNDHHKLSPWVNGIGLTNASGGPSASRPSFRRWDGHKYHESRIDQVFASDPRIVVDSSPYDANECLTQHLPMFLRTNVEYCARKELYQGRKRANVMHSASNRANRIAENADG